MQDAPAVAWAGGVPETGGLRDLLAWATKAAAAVRTTSTHETVHTLHPGQVAFAVRGEKLETLLGSCVAVILTDERHSFGAMCHIVHAKAPVRLAQESCAYGPLALEVLDAMLLARGITPAMCVAHVYGGGNMFPQLYEQGGVGQLNVEWVLDALPARGVQVQLHDLGGKVYRRVQWTVGDDQPQITSTPV